MSATAPQLVTTSRNDPRALAATVDAADRFVADCADHLAAHPLGWAPPLSQVEKVQGLLAYNAFRATAPPTAFT